MRDYELLLIIRPQLDEVGATEVVKQIIELIRKKGNTLTSTHVWGRRKLAYPIDRQIEATYVLLKFKAVPASLRELEFALKLNEALLRFMIVKDQQPQVVDLQESAPEKTPAEVTTPPEAPASQEAASEIVAAVEEGAAPEDGESVTETAAPPVEVVTEGEAADEVIPETVS